MPKKECATTCAARPALVSSVSLNLSIFYLAFTPDIASSLRRRGWPLHRSNATRVPVPSLTATVIASVLLPTLETTASPALQVSSLPKSNSGTAMTARRTLSARSIRAQAFPARPATTTVSRRRPPSRNTRTSSAAVTSVTMVSSATFARTLPWPILTAWISVRRSTTHDQFTSSCKGATTI
jgi:hypothetical protein